VKFGFISGSESLVRDGAALIWAGRLFCFVVDWCRRFDSNLTVTKVIGEMLLQHLYDSDIGYQFIVELPHREILAMKAIQQTWG